MSCCTFKCADRLRATERWKREQGYSAPNIRSKVDVLGLLSSSEIYKSADDKKKPASLTNSIFIVFPYVYKRPGTSVFKLTKPCITTAQELPCYIMGFCVVGT